MGKYVVVINICYDDYWYIGFFGKVYIGDVIFM